MSFRTVETASISVVVIGRDEEVALRQLLPRLLAMRGVREVLFCDGGSRDSSCAVAAHFGARVLVASGGRGVQLRAGAAVASGEALWFLHADAWPHKSAAASITRACRDAQVLGGNFRLRFASRSPWARGFEGIARAQRLAGIYYGDSGMWVRRAIYEEIGGFAPWPLFEDYDFARRLEHFARERGARTACLRPAIVASPRRFQREPWRVLWLWLSMQRRFQRGEDPRALAQEYHRAK
jgi:glycosyltransferase involved in cell wall biosynthesis